MLSFEEIKNLKKSSELNRAEELYLNIKNLFISKVKFVSFYLIPAGGFFFSFMVLTFLFFFPNGSFVFNPFSEKILFFSIFSLLFGGVFSGLLVELLSFFRKNYNLKNIHHFIRDFHKSKHGSIERIFPFEAVLLSREIKECDDKTLFLLDNYISTPNVEKLQTKLILQNINELNYHNFENVKEDIIEFSKTLKKQEQIDILKAIESRMEEEANIETPDKILSNIEKLNKRITGKNEKIEGITKKEKLNVQL